MQTRLAVVAAAALVASTAASLAQDVERRPAVSAVAPSLQGQKAWGFLPPATSVSRDEEGPATTMSLRRPRAERLDR